MNTGNELIDQIMTLSPPQERQDEPDRGIADLAPTASGRTKIQLRYLTGKPLHLRSLLLAQHGLKPPFIEEACVLLPHTEVYPFLECFLPALETLKVNQVVPDDSELQDYRILDLDRTTLSYIISTGKRTSNGKSV